MSPYEVQLAQLQHEAEHNVKVVTSLDNQIVDLKQQLTAQDTKACILIAVYAMLSLVIGICIGSML